MSRLIKNFNVKIFHTVGRAVHNTFQELSRGPHKIHPRAAFGPRAALRALGPELAHLAPVSSGRAATEA